MLVVHCSKFCLSLFNSFSSSDIPHDLRLKHSRAQQGASLGQPGLLKDWRWLASKCVTEVKCVFGPRPLYTLVNGQAYQFMEAAMS